MKRIRLLLIFLAIVLALAPICDANSKTITLRWVNFLPGPHPSTTIYKIFTERVDELAKGELVMKFAGGPEVIKSMDLAMSVKNGVVDIGHLPATYYEGLVPGAGIIELSELTPQEERESGAIGILREMHRKAGLFPIGRGVCQNRRQFHIVLKKRVNTLKDLDGKILGASGMLFSGVAKGFDMGFTLIPLPDSFTAIQRGVVDGYVMPFNTFTGFGVHEVAKYVIHHPFFYADTLTIINLDKWNSLPKQLQTIILEAQAATESLRAKDERAKIYWDRPLKILKKAGVELLEFSPSDAERYVKTIYRIETERQLKMAPEYGPRLLKAVKK
ncbi:MAG: TRAP transporter substrate-binding protein DctP [Deltaproteobacteria bacterium]|nr:TRAP transporter substrate-binding protein DctP [Deltaproteobacteria bacterium]